MPVCILKYFLFLSQINYIYLLGGNEDSLKFMNWFKNSVVLTLISVVGTLIVCYIIAYGLSMYEYKLKNFLFFLMTKFLMELQLQLKK